jgi:hypothetical protein
MRDVVICERRPEVSRKAKDSIHRAKKGVDQKQPNDLAAGILAANGDCDFPTAAVLQSEAMTVGSRRSVRHTV